MVLMIARIVPQPKCFGILTLFIGKMRYLKVFEYKIQYLERREQLCDMVQYMGNLLDVSTQHRGLRDIFDQCNSKTGKGKDTSEPI